MAEINDAVEKIQPVEGSEEKAEETVESKNVSSSNGEENTGSTAEKRSAEDTDANPAPAKVVKLGFSIGSLAAKKPPGISIKLGVTKPKEAPVAIIPKKPSLASVFNEDDDSEPEEMPPEAKMRMKNIGRDTPTSAGPNSFNKGKHGFSDNQKLWERKMKTTLEQQQLDD